ncbi:glycoside hydrolase family 3 C-terminal domain-containing protein [Neobacillus cucumis]|uniref:beta-glucosidase n=1 Tax=Neobacillus cucumis TaxID=1740721 RepID=UPI0020412E91|nr:glycoside hydrolase family 3 C-terminal domain-containing protein [Neobacillus cucumis]MCM3727219.1 glycoside hydrolase family 3 C-terminal domain-containing protein [Neobacillus cucumis]
MLKRLKGKSKLFAITISSSLLYSGFTFDLASAETEYLPRVQKSQTSTIQKNAPYLADAASIDRVIRAMTLEEKAKFVVGVGMPGISRGPFEITGAVGGTYGVPRLGIPELRLADGPAGLRIRPTRPGQNQTYFATAFPIATSLASTWDTAVAEAVGEAQGNEVKEYGIDLFLAPALDIQRNPLNGRNFEYYSEDPLISGKMAASFVNGIQSNGVGATIKHFAANNQETNRMIIDTIVSQRALREIYLKGFEIAVKESSPWAVMSSYNKINGTYASESTDLLTTVLRKDWGYKGFVMTDWFAGKDPVEQMKAGNGLIMPGSPKKSNLIRLAVEGGRLNEKILDRNIKNILRIVIQTPEFKKYQNSDQPDLKAHAMLARKAASEGMVLLKNKERALPINKNKKIALFGNTQIETIKGGNGSGDVNAAYTVSIAEGLKEAGYQINQELLSKYKTYIDSLRQQEPYKIKPHPWGEDFGKLAPVIPEKPLQESEITAASKDTDLGIIVIGRNSGEAEDRKVVKGDYLLSDAEQDMISRVTTEYHNQGKKVAVILNIGGPIEVASWRDKVDSILVAWQPGQEAGNAVADVVSGIVNPSGKLTTTFPVKYSDVPSAANFPGTPAENPAKVIYEEGIYVGYRYFTTFGVKPAYEFGYGLSYTDFDISHVQINKGKKFKDKLTISAMVENTGSLPGREVVQVYVSAPDGGLEKPSVELRAFAKTKVLQPNQRQLLHFNLNAKDLASFDEEKSTWVLEKGTYTVKVGASSENIKGSATYTVDHDVIVQKVSDVLKPKVDFKQPTKQ